MAKQDRQAAKPSSCQHAAHKLAARAVQLGIEVRICVPEEPGTKGPTTGSARIMSSRYSRPTLNITIMEIENAPTRLRTCHLAWGLCVPGRCTHGARNRPARRIKNPCGRAARW